MRNYICRCFLIYILTLGLVYCGHAQTSEKKLVGNPMSDISMLLKGGKHKADIMDSLLVTPQVAKIAEKFQIAFRKNYSWFIDYMKDVPPGEPLPYHENMGISKAEYETFLEFGKNPVAISSGQETLQIERNGEIISFKGTGRIARFNYVKIDLATKSVTYKGYELPYIDSVRITSDKNGLKSKWFGYTFSFEEPKDITLEALKDPANLSSVKYTLTVGQLEKNKKTLLRLSGLDIENGRKTVDFELLLVFE